MSDSSLLHDFLGWAIGLAVMIIPMRLYWGKWPWE